jgi:hypothetical protein
MRVAFIFGLAGGRSQWPEYFYLSAVFRVRGERREDLVLLFLL